MFNRRTSFIILIIISMFVSALSVIPYAHANTTNVEISSVTGTNTEAPITCFDGTFYYAVWADNNNVYYAYSQQPNATQYWNVKTIHTGDSNGVVFGTSCGYGQNLYVIYSQNTFANFTANVRYVTISGSTMSASKVAFSLSESGGGVQTSEILLPEIMPFNVPLGGTGFVFGVNFIIAQCNSGNLEVFSSDLQWIGAYTIARTGDCSAIPYQLQMVANNPNVVYDCDDSHGSGLCATNFSTNNALGDTNFSNGAWQPITYIAGTGAYILLTSNTNSSKIWVAGTYHVSGSAYNTDYIEFTPGTSTWSAITTNVLQWGNPTPALPNSIVINPVKFNDLPRIYYYAGQTIYYIYPENETMTNQHTLLNTGENLYYVYVNSSPFGLPFNWFAVYNEPTPTPSQLQFASNIIFLNVVFSTSTKTVTVVTTKAIVPQLASCTDTNSCVTNQSGEFMVILLPEIIIIAVFEYFPYKLGVKDERVYIFIFMVAISGVGFLSALGAFAQNGIPFYIPIFCDIIGFVLILSFKGNSGGSGF